MAKEKFKNCGEDIIEVFRKVEGETYIPVEVKFVFICNSTQKSLIKISKVPEQFVELVKGDLLVMINEEYFDAMDDDTIKILMEQELTRIEVNMDKGTIKIVKPSLQTSIGVVKKYSFEKVSNANECERLFEEQKKDNDKSGK